MKTIAIRALGFLAVGLAVALIARHDPPADDSEAEPSWMRYRTGTQPVVGLGDADRVREQYERWKEQTAEPYLVELFPSDPRGLPELGRGSFLLDVERRRVVSRVEGGGDLALDLWVIDNADWPDNPAVPDSEDAALRLGAYEPEGADAVLERSVVGLIDEELSIDVVVVTPRGLGPFDGELALYGSPTLFQRLYALEDGLAREARGVGAGLLGLAVPQSGGVATGFPEVFDDLVTEGEDLFFNETFEGNGRTCGTCHFAVNNFTIDTELIASLPLTDPLFVAETEPPLIFGHEENLDEKGDPRRFENPALMRAFGLIVENLDGTGDLDERFTMRGVPHNIGMSVSVERPGGQPGFPDAPDERTGWSGDGSPFGFFSCDSDGDPSISPGILVRGTTRSFALGAVIQHFPRTMDRDFCPPDADFRLPTDGELDAFEAFFFSLGRQHELNLAAGALDELILADDRAERGKVLFRDAGVGEFPNAFTCNACHTNAGANPGGAANSNIDTNVEEFLQNRLGDPNFTVVGEPRPIDGGFGLNPSGTFDELIPGPGNGNENFGDGRFNTVSVVEAADTAPFFHPNVAFTVEESIEFYESDEFSPEPAGKIRFTDVETDQVAAFMRAINALDNVENLAAPRAKKAAEAIVVSDPNADDVIRFLLEVAIADTEDAAEVLRASGLHDTGGLPVNAVAQLRRATTRLAQAQNPQPPDFVRIGHIESALDHMDKAVALIRLNPQ